ncbi:MAG: aldo/keto reductase [Patescibacteria group bacterium]
MKIPSKQLKNGFAMPIYGLGTWQMGGRFSHNPLNNDVKDIKAIRTAIELGVTHFDTAEVYANGYAETLLGKAIKNYDRSKLFIVSKASPDHFKHNHLIKSCKASLGRLGIHYLDLYLLHQYSPGIPLKETIKTLDELVAQKFIKNIGVSNFTKEHLAEAQSYTKNKIVCNQVHYSLEFREPEVTGLLDYCQANDVLLTAWRPVGKGKLLKRIPKILRDICVKYEKTPAQVAINWLTSQAKVITLSKTSTIDHLKENLGAIGWQMQAKDIEKLRQKYPKQKTVSDTVPLG